MGSKMKKLRIFADNLFAHEMLHFSAGIIMFFALYKMFGLIEYGIIAFLVSLLIDADHYLESLIANNFKFYKIFDDPPHIYWKKLGRMTLLLHSWELLILILILGRIMSQEPLALAIVLPAILHYSIDSFIYSGFGNMPILIYFLTYRFYYRFDIKKLCPGNTDNGN